MSSKSTDKLLAMAELVKNLGLTPEKASKLISLHVTWEELNLIDVNGDYDGVAVPVLRMEFAP